MSFGSSLHEQVRGAERLLTVVASCRHQTHPIRSNRSKLNGGDPHGHQATRRGCGDRLQLHR